MSDAVSVGGVRCPVDQVSSRPPVAPPDRFAGSWSNPMDAHGGGVDAEVLRAISGLPASLASGHYDEAAEQAAFSAAVMEWRNGGKAPGEARGWVLTLTLFAPPAGDDCY